MEILEVCNFVINYSLSSDVMFDFINKKTKINIIILILVYTLIHQYCLVKSFFDI